MPKALSVESVKKSANSNWPKPSEIDISQPFVLPGFAEGEYENEVARIIIQEAVLDGDQWKPFSINQYSEKHGETWKNQNAIIGLCSKGYLHYPHLSTDINRNKPYELTQKFIDALPRKKKKK